MINFSLIPALVAGLGLLAGQVAAKLDPRYDLTGNELFGRSVWGTIDAPRLDKFRHDGSLDPKPAKRQSFEPYPETGVVREFDLWISRHTVAPDGYERQALLVNGEFPGPMIEANWGDKLHITVHNNITGPEEGTALHTHGLLHTLHPWEDGVPGISQCPVAPGQAHTYEVTADQYGTSWYHSHYSVQYAGGFWGPLVIHGPAEDEYDIDVGPIMVSDYYHGDYNHVIDPLLTPNLTDGGVWSQNNLINGRMHFDCANMTAGDDSTCHSDAPMSQFRFEKGKKHLLRLINSGGEALQRFSIDEHSMTIVANDFVPVEPYEAKVVFLSPGQRTDVIVEAAGDKSAYWMRSNITVGCSGSLQPNALAGVYYDDADASADPESIPWDISDPGLCQNDDLELSVPRHAVALPEADLELEIVYQWFYNSDWIFRFTANGIAFANDAADPSLLAANDGRTAFPEENNVINLGEAQSVRVVAYNNMSEPHPMHLHGFNMYIIEQGGAGEAYNGSVVRPENPQRRDTFITAPYGYTVFQFDAGANPGIWPMHCHTAAHSATGMFLQFLSSPLRTAQYDIPDKMARQCQAWIETGIVPIGA